MCSSLAPDVVCVVETWLDKNIDDTEIFVQGYCVHRVDRNRHGGGVLIFVKSLFSCSVLFSGSPEFEFIILSIKCSVGPSPDFCVALFYRPPGSSYSLLDRLFSTLCNIFISLPNQVFLVGDFNIDFFSTNIYFAF